MSDEGLTLGSLEGFPQARRDDEVFLNCLYVVRSLPKDYSALFSFVNVNGSQLRMKLDAGASRNVVLHCNGPMHV